MEVKDFQSSQDKQERVPSKEKTEGLSGVVRTQIEFLARDGMVG
jgi:hypothetical protein